MYMLDMYSGASLLRTLYMNKPLLLFFVKKFFYFFVGSLFSSPLISGQ